MTLLSMEFFWFLSKADLIFFLEAKVRAVVHRHVRQTWAEALIWVALYPNNQAVNLSQAIVLSCLLF